ncbi:hypothetical protein GCM10010315_16230 [Streptomyces luteosporeus]|uniref:Uncharacterized protein n=1 Tax=Streptomyces luteosporeus TaxID=173856 RepID=A0ABN3TNH2_9ACTN
MTTRATAIQINVLTAGHVTLRARCSTPGRRRVEKDGAAVSTLHSTRAPIRLHPPGT